MSGIRVASGHTLYSLYTEGIIIMAQPQDFQTAMQAELQELRAGFEKAMSEAQGNTTLMQQASQEFQSRIQEVMQRYQQLMTAAAEPTANAIPRDVRENTYSNDRCSLDLNAIAYRGDRNQFHVLLQDKTVAEIVAVMQKQRAVLPKNKRLLSRALRMSKQMAPQLFSVFDNIRDKIKLNIKVELYAVQDPHFNAFCMHHGDDKYSICFHSGLLERFSEAELAFVVGHELGHALFDHARIQVSGMLQMFGQHLTPVQMIKLRAWERAGEISADRIGLICAGGFIPAATAFFKLSSGISDDRYKFELNDYMEQYSDLASYLKENDGPDIDDVYSSHPFNPIRLKALELFSRSDIFKKSAGSGTSELKIADVENEIMSFVRLMEPGYLDDKSDVGQAVKDFFFYSGYLVTCADGRVSEAELHKLASFLDPNQMQGKLDEVRGLKEDDLMPRILELSKVVSLNLPLVSKLNLIRDLMTVMVADGEIAAEEVRVMENVCSVLGINPDFVHASIDAMVSAA